MPFVAFSHGANDAQKTMAKITLALFGSGYLPEVPTLARSSRAGRPRVAKTGRTRRAPTVRTTPTERDPSVILPGTSDRRAWEREGRGR